MLGRCIYPLQVPVERSLPDPPLLNLEAEAANAYLSTLLHILAANSSEMQRVCAVESRLVRLCMRNLERFEQQATADSTAAENLGEFAEHALVPWDLTLLRLTLRGESHLLSCDFN